METDGKNVMGWIQDYRQRRLERKIWREVIEMAIEHINTKMAEACIECDGNCEVCEADCHDCD